MNQEISSNQDELNNPKFNAAGQNEIRSVKDARQALQIAKRLDDDDGKRDEARARVMAAFNGNAPYSDAELVAAGQGYRFNVSFGLMEGVVGRATVPYTELLSDSQYVADIEGDLPEEKLKLMRERFNELVKKWGRWPKLTSRLIQDLVLNGYNTVAFPSDYDPWPVFIQQKDGFVHEKTPNDVADLELFVWKRDYLIHELYKYIEDPAVAKKVGWNVEVTRKAIENAVPQDILQEAGSRGGGWVEIEQAIRAGTLYSSMSGGKVIHTYHVFAAELDGSVSHFIALDRRGEAVAEVKNDEVELFKRFDRWPSMDEMMVYFDLEPGDGQWHGSRGLGRRTFNSHRSQDKLRCSLLDQSFTSGQVILQAKDQEGQEAFQLAVIGPFTVIPLGVDVNATTVPSVPTTAFQVDALLSTTLEQRIGDVVPSVSTPTRRGNQTATAANIANSRAMMVSKSNLVRFLDPLSKMISIIVRRLLKKNSPNSYAKEFQRDLEARGFTRAELEKVRGAKSTGRVEKVMGEDRANYTELMGIYRGDPDVNQKNLKERHLASVIGPKASEGLLISMEDQTIQIESARMQMEEISANQNGLPVPVSPRDNHEIHLAVAVKWLAGEIQKYTQGAPETTAASILNAVGAHADEHLGFLKADKTKKALADQFGGQLKQLAEALSQLQAAAQKTAENQLTAAGGGGTLPQGLPSTTVGGMPPA